MIVRRSLLVLLAVLGGVGVAVWGTWPLGTSLATHVVDPDQIYRTFGWTIRPDIYLTVWILAWDVHALATNPLGLFNANIFYPAVRTLAASEHMLGALPLYAPLALASGDPVFAHQATLLLTFACTFLAALALVRDWTGSWPAGILAGALLAFSPERALQLGSLHLLGEFYLPLVLLCARRAVVEDRRRWSLLLALLLVLQGLYSYSVGYAAFLGVAVLCATVVPVDRGVRPRWRRLVFPVLAAALIVGLVSIPYVIASRAGHIPAPDLAGLELRSAIPTEILAPRAALVLAPLVLLTGRRALAQGVGGAWLVALVAMGLAGYLVALGPTLRIGWIVVSGPYAWLARAVPGFYAVRFPSRFRVLVVMALCILAGIAVAGLLEWIAVRAGRWGGSLRRLAAASVVLAAAWSVQSFCGGPVWLKPIETRDTLAPADRWLAQAPPGAVLELPFHDCTIFYLDREAEALRMYRSVYHWHPIVNGYSGYAPATYRLMAAMAAHLPSPAAIRDHIELAGIRYVVVDDSLWRPTRNAWKSSSLPRVEFDGQTVYELPPSPIPGPVPLARERAFWHGRTPRGVSLAPLSGAAQRGALKMPAFSPVPLIPSAMEVWVTVENWSGVDWPGVAPPGMGGVGLTVQFWDVAGRPVFPTPFITPLGIDILRSQVIPAPVWVQFPPKPGVYTLVVRLAQDGVGLFDSTQGGVLSTRVEVTSEPLKFFSGG